VPDESRYGRLQERNARKRKRTRGEQKENETPEADDDQLCMQSNDPGDDQNDDAILLTVQERSELVLLKSQCAELTSQATILQSEVAMLRSNNATLQTENATLKNELEEMKRSKTAMFTEDFFKKMKMC